MAAEKKSRQNRPLSSSEMGLALVAYIHEGLTFEELADRFGVAKDKVARAAIVHGWIEAKHAATEASAKVAREYSRDLVAVQRQVCQDDLAVGNRLARISATLVRSLERTAHDLEEADEKGAAACEWRLSRLAAAWERVQKARRLAVGLSTDHVQQTNTSPEAALLAMHEAVQAAGEEVSDDAPSGPGPGPAVGQDDRVGSPPGTARGA